MNYFDGKKIRDEILDQLKVQVDQLGVEPVLAVIWVGDDFASARYIEVKQRAAEKVGIHFDLIKYSDNVEKTEIETRIKELNENQKVVGVMVQVPMPKKFDLVDIISIISPEKDVDGLRFCSNLSCDFRPPVTLSIMQAIERSGVNLADSKVAIIGKGFLVGSPIARMLERTANEVRIAYKDTPYLGTITLDADIIISATGVADIIKPNMIKTGAVLIDAGTTEVGGKLAGDVDGACYKKASYYTPVPGGIGPVTVAMLMKNVVSAAQKKV
ncbi:MAG: Bifunctional protein FolD protein [bacterium ADurb.Bin212]|nr:MAG: Bifunctional protein FolD protein [bacterium ADurb.Bin212]